MHVRLDALLVYFLALPVLCGLILTDWLNIPAGATVFTVIVGLIVAIVVEAIRTSRQKLSYEEFDYLSKDVIRLFCLNAGAMLVVGITNNWFVQTSTFGAMIFGFLAAFVANGLIQWRLKQTNAKPVPAR